MLWTAESFPPLKACNVLRKPSSSQTNAPASEETWPLGPSWPSESSSSPPSPCISCTICFTQTEWCTITSHQLATTYTGPRISYTHSSLRLKYGDPSSTTRRSTHLYNCTHVKSRESERKTHPQWLVCTIPKFGTELYSFNIHYLTFNSQY